MSWKTDWLYALIFDQVRKLWRQTHPEFRSEVDEPPLERLVIQEIVEPNLTRPILSGQVCRVWRFEEAEFELQDSDDVGELTIRRNETIGGSRCRYFVQGWVRFYITPDRKQVYLDFLIGPLNGRGCTYDVHGQGYRGTLGLPCGRWVS